MSYNRWAPYVSVAKRREKAIKKMAQLQKKGKVIQPVEIAGRTISKSFWGKAWCNHLESFSDYDNRLPRGRTYVRNGSVCHLAINAGKIEAFVAGSKLYNVNASISALSAAQWQGIKQACTGQVASVLDLLRGKLSDGVMKVVTDKKTGLFPQEGEIELSCNCPDWASMCKHIAAVLYAVAARLDETPEMLFLLRSVDHQELVDANLILTPKTSKKPALKGDLADIFGIDLSEEVAPSKGKKQPTKKPKTAVKPPLVFSINAKGIAKMRKKFAMNVSQYARLVGVSAATIKRWETMPRLKLHSKNLKQLEKLSVMSKQAAYMTNNTPVLR